MYLPKRSDGGTASYCRPGAWPTLDSGRSASTNRAAGTGRAQLAQRARRSPPDGIKVALDFIEQQVVAALKPLPKIFLRNFACFA